MITKTLSYLNGKRGRIYVARNGTLMVYKLDIGETWFTNCIAPSPVIFKLESDQYWINSIDWAGGFSDYFFYGMTYDPNPKSYPKAKPNIALTQEQLTKLEKRASLSIAAGNDK